MVQVGFKTNALQWEERFKKVGEDINRNSELVVRDVARFGYFLTKGISPYKTGALRKGIQYKCGKKWFEITSNQPRTFDKRGQIPYHLWMHGIGKYNTMHRIKSGTPNYMNATATTLYALFHKKLNISLHTVISKRFK